MKKQKEKGIEEERKLIEKTDQAYKNKLDDAEQEKLSQLNEIAKLKEERITE